MQGQLLWVTAANVLYLVSYSVRDIFWLRILTICGAALLIPYYWMQPSHLRAAVGWNLVFIAVNVVWVVVLILERRPVTLTPDEARLRDIAFPSLTSREARKLFRLGVWEDVAPGESPIGHADNQRLSVILRGSADVTVGDKKIAELGEGQFLGAIEKHAEPLGVAVVAREPMRVMRWPSESMRSFLQKRPDAALALSRSAGREVRELLGDAVTRVDARETH